MIKKSILFFLSITIILCHGRQYFFLPYCLFCLPHRRWTMLVALEHKPQNMSFGDLELHDHSAHVSLGINRSGPGTNSTTNHKFHMALRQLHGPRCQQPVRN